MWSCPRSIPIIAAAARTPSYSTSLRRRQSGADSGGRGAAISGAVSYPRDSRPKGEVRQLRRAPGAAGGRQGHGVHRSVRGRDLRAGGTLRRSPALGWEPRVRPTNSSAGRPTANWDVGITLHVVDLARPVLMSPDWRRETATSWTSCAGRAPMACRPGRLRCPRTPGAACMRGGLLQIRSSMTARRRQQTNGPYLRAAPNRVASGEQGLRQGAGLG